MKAIARIVIALAIIFALAAPAMAEDKLVTTKVQSVKIAKDKNGTEYVRLMVEQPKELNGVAYTTAVAAMAFGPMVVKAKALKAGDSVKMIVSEKEYQGRASLTIQAFAN